MTDDKKTRETAADLVNRGLKIIGPNPPRRYLALQDWGEAAVTPGEYERLREKVLRSNLVDLGPRAARALLDEVITRACDLLFALIESGGLCVKQPQKIFQEIKLDTSAALCGYLKLPVGRAAATTNAPASEGESRQRSTSTGSSGDGDGALAPDEAGEEIGVRQPLHQLGANHLLAFTFFRKKLERAADGDGLLPPLPNTAKKFKNRISLPWLADYTGTPTWRKVFDYWLKSQIEIIRKEDRDYFELKNLEKKAAWNDVVAIAAWRLEKKERFAFISAYRQRKLTTASLPESKLQKIISGEKWSFGEEHRLVKENKDDSEIMTAGPELPAIFGEIRNLLAAVMSDPENTKNARARIDEVLKAADREEGRENDAENLLKWFFAMLKDEKLAAGSVFSHGQIALRFCEEIYPQKFAEVSTSDVAGYIDNVCGSPNTVRNVRTALKKFAGFLKKAAFPFPGINWNSRDLKAFERGRERDVLSEKEYQKVRRHLMDKKAGGAEPLLEDLVLMTLLRRCGLRIGEVSWLTAEDFWGISQFQLKVPKSKTRSGTNRQLPLYLLLDQTEQRELITLIERKKCRPPEAGFLFTADNGERLASSALGVRAEKILRSSGLAGETAHGLRHALASSLFALLYLQSSRDLKQNKYTKILDQFCRAETDGFPVRYPYHIQLIMGHADLFVTFDRYIHLVEIAVWHVVEENKINGEKEKISVASAAALMGQDIEQLKIVLKKANFSAPVSQIHLNELLLKRVRRIKNQSAA